MTVALARAIATGFAPIKQPPAYGLAMKNRRGGFL